MSGLFASFDKGNSWMDLELPHEKVASVLVSPDDQYLYAGTQPAGLYRSSDEGSSWELCHSFERLPGKDEWEQLGHGGPQVRDLTAHPRAPSKLFVAVEAEGVYVSPDYGDTWNFRSYGLQRDPHSLQMLAQDTVVATCGRGLYRTENAGRAWHRVDTHRRHFWFSYFREAVRMKTDGTIYTSGEDRAEARFENNASGRIFKSTDEGKTWDHEEFPGEEDDFVNAWTSSEDTVVGGTINGWIINGPDDWVLATNVDSTIRSLVFSD
jgi:hypothetical protein